MEELRSKTHGDCGGQRRKKLPAGARGCPWRVELAFGADGRAADHGRTAKKKLATGRKNPYAQGKTTKVKKMTAAEKKALRAAERTRLTEEAKNTKEALDRRVAAAARNRRISGCR